MDITNYTNYLTSTNSTSNTNVQRTVDKDFSSATEEELMDACKEFEAYFIEQVMKEVTKTVNLTGVEDSTTSQLTEYYLDEVISGLAEQVSDTGKMGLAQQIFEQMKRNYDID